MKRRSDVSDVERFLSRHERVKTDGMYTSGELFDCWRITAFLGRGGSGEVYRVVNVVTGEAAALKTALTPEARHAERIAREANFLSENHCVFFPQFFCKGIRDGVPYFVMELLEEGEIPHKDKEVAQFLFAIGEAVAALHRRGFVHRDIKPSNIMYRVSREASRGVEPVLIDLGLLKKCDVEESRIEEIPSVTLVDGHAAGAGTPRYCAPEQFSGGSLSPASDVHALGVLADECFGGRAPRAWAKIISRATSSLPSHRYRDVDSFVRAIRRRYRMRWFLVCGLAVLAVGIFCMAGLVEGLYSDVSAGMAVQQEGVGAVPRSKFESGIDYADDGSFGENMMTNVVSEELLSVTYTTNRFGDKTPSGWSYRVTTNTMPVTLVRLEHQEKTFRKPIRLEVGREYRIVGPGILDAAFEKPDDTVRVVLENCFFNNRSTDHPETAKIRYALTGKAEMNFTEFENVIKGDKFYEPYDYWTSKICFGKKDAMEYFRRKVKNPAKIVIKHGEDE